MFFEAFQNNNSITKISFISRDMNFSTFNKLVNIIKNKDNIKTIYILFNNNQFRFINQLNKIKNKRFIFEVNEPHLTSNFNFKSILKNLNIYEYIIINNGMTITDEYKDYDDPIDLYYKYDNKEYKDDIYYIINNCNIENFNISSLWLNNEILKDLHNNKNKNIKNIKYNDLIPIGSIKLF